MRLSLILVPALTCIGFVSSCDKEEKNRPGAAGLPPNSSQYSQRVVPADFPNTKNGLGEVVSSLNTQAGEIKGPGKQLGLKDNASVRGVVASLTDSHLFSRAALNLMLDTSPTFPPTGGYPFPPTGGYPSPDSADFPMPNPGDNNDPTPGSASKLQGCDAFFASIDQQVEAGFGQLKNALSQVKEEEFLKVPGVTKGEKAANEAFRYSLSVNEKEGSAQGSIAGGANDHAAFLKASGAFSINAKSQNQPVKSSSANAEVTIEQGLVDASVLIDTQASVLRLGGGISASGRNGADPVRLLAASFLEMTGGKTPSILLELKGEAEGKLDPKAPTTTGQADLHLALIQSTDKVFTLDFKADVAANNGNESQKIVMNLNAEFGVTDGQCAVKKVTCAAEPITLCKSFDGWTKN
jgi:hypothetical protein